MKRFSPVFLGLWRVAEDDRAARLKDISPDGLLERVSQSLNNSLTSRQGLPQSRHGASWERRRVNDCKKLIDSRRHC